MDKKWTFFCPNKVKKKKNCPNNDLLRAGIAAVRPTFVVDDSDRRCADKQCDDSENGRTFEAAFAGDEASRRLRTGLLRLLPVVLCSMEVTSH